MPGEPEIDPDLAQDVDLLIEEVSRLFPVQLPLDEAAWKIAAAACLARCRELLVAAMASYEAGAGGVAAVLYRSLYETWLWGHYLLAGQDEAVKRLFGEREWFVGRMTFGDTMLSSEGVPVAEPGMAADDEEPWASVSPNIRAVALRVADLRGPEYRSVVLTVHEGAWRRACFVAAHVSWAVLERYAEQEETASFASAGMSPRPWASEEDNVVTHTCAALVLDLAEQVVGRLALPDADGLARARDRLAAHRP